jgi:hypothetical protein
MNRRYKIASLIGIVVIALVLLTRQTLPTLKPQTTYTVEISTFVQNRSESANGALGTLTLSYILGDTSELNTVVIKSYPFSPIIKDTIKIPTDARWLLIGCDLRTGLEPDLRHTFDWNSVIYDYANSTFYVDLSRLSQPDIVLELYFYGP